MLGIFLDTETNGLDYSKHRIVEIAFRILNMKTGEEYASYHRFVGIGEKEWKLSDPQSLHINGVDYSMIQDAPSEEHVADEIKSIFNEHKIRRGKAAYICQNPSFDRLFFSKLIPVAEQEKNNWPYHWLDLASMFWGISLKNHQRKPWEVGISKNQIARFLKIPPEDLPHRAIGGVDHLIACYKELVGFCDPVTSKS